MNPSIMYGNPENSPLTSAYKGNDYSKSTWGTSTPQLVSIAADIYGAIKNQKMTGKSISQLRDEMRRNKEKMIYEWQKEDAENQLSAWMGGQQVYSGTSVSGVLESNKKIVDANIADMERAYNRQIKNLQKQARNKLLGSILTGVGAVVGTVIAPGAGTVIGASLGSEAGSAVAN